MDKFERELARIETAKQNNLNFFNSHIISKQLYNYNRMTLNGQKVKLIKHYREVKECFCGKKMQVLKIKL